MEKRIVTKDFEGMCGRIKAGEILTVKIGGDWAERLYRNNGDLVTLYGSRNCDKHTAVYISILENAEDL